eukprot:gb/GECG01006771.1/.p1 GENE.gb/GECG01006771.1/~~gb/GECG01006771.1/.p1  ORF type:complete len:1104 (+),score=135.91 gb/GECG01006771.1/:1-3312(+)
MWRRVAHHRTRSATSSLCSRRWLRSHSSFEVVHEQSLPEFSAYGRLYRHKNTGGEVLSLRTDENGGPLGKKTSSEDENKVFGIGFKTIPTRSNGVAHILEHSVLCGSRKYPVKDPFLHLMRSSLQTFLNAMTYPDKTLYPVSSPNEADFYNLVDVYLDSVFHPRLSPLVLAQEGWHYEWRDCSDSDTTTSPPLQYNGVVFNEMKGVYSSPDFLTSFNVQKNLFPDTNYSISSGGDPAVIPTLTFDEFKKFHETHYHPSNAKAYFYGDDPEEARLEKIDEYYKDFSAAGCSHGISVQNPFVSPKKVEGSYPSSLNDDDTEDHYLVMGWVLDHPTERNSGGYEFEFDGADKIGLMILSHLLMGNETATLYKSLADSGLGSAVFGTGFDDHLLQFTFDVGLKGVNPDKLDKVEPHILDTLREVKQKGFDKEHIDATLNTIEFSLREIAGSSSNKGLALLFGGLTSWMHGENPLPDMSYETDLAIVKQRLADRPDYLTSLLDKCLLSNNHRVTVHMRPDGQLAEVQEKEEKQKLQHLADNLTEQDKQDVDELANRLQQWQTEPSSPENLATLPQLSLDDIDRKAREYRCDIEPVSLGDVSTTAPMSYTSSDSNNVSILNAYDFSKHRGEAAAPLYISEQATSGLVYGGIHFDTQWLPGSLLHVLPLISLTGLGTTQLSEIELSREIGRYTGGISNGVSVNTVPGRPDVMNSQMSISGKATSRNAQRLVDLMLTCIQDADFSRRDLIRTKIRETMSDMQTDLISSAHTYMSGYLSSLFTPDGALSRRLNGIDHLRFLQKLSGALESSDPNVADGAWHYLQKSMEFVRSITMRKTNAMLTLKGDAQSLPGTQAALEKALQQLPSSEGAIAEAEECGNALLEQIGYEAPHGDSNSWPRPAAWDGPVKNETHGLAFEISSQVNYAGKALPLYAKDEGRTGHTLVGGADEVISSLLATTHLWENIRMQGGAYGAFASLNPLNGLMTFMSFRDPELSKSIQVYDNAADFITQLGEEISDQELSDAIISTIGSIDSPLSPQGKGSVAIRRKMLGITQESVQQRRDEILSTSRRDFQLFGERLKTLSENGVVAVAGSSRSIASDELCKKLPHDKL